VGSPFKDLEDINEVSIQEILINMLDGEKNLDLKTHIHKPKQLSALVILSKYLKDNNCVKSSKLLDAFLLKFLRYMVSFDRLSRIEVIEAISSALERELKKDSNPDIK